jgi:hypothetical protein
VRFLLVHGAHLERLAFTLPDEFDGDLHMVLIALRRRQLELLTENTTYPELVTCDGQVPWRAEGAWRPETGSSLQKMLSHCSAAPAT